MSTANSTASGGSTGTSDQTPDEIDSCAVCDSSLERRSQHSSTNRQTILFGCAEWRVGTVTIVDQRGPLTERCTGRLDRAQSRAMTGLSAYRVVAFITADLPSGRYTIERVDEHQFTIGLPETPSPWDVLRLADSLSVGPLSAERIDGAVLVTDAHRSGRNRKLSEAELEEFRQTVHDSPDEAGYDGPAWTTKLVRHHLEETYDVEYSIPSCRRLLNEAGLSYQQPRPENAKAEPEDRERFDDELKKSARRWTPQ